VHLAERAPFVTLSEVKGAMPGMVPFAALRVTKGVSRPDPGAGAQQSSGAAERPAVPLLLSRFLAASHDQGRVLEGTPLLSFRSAPSGVR
jgi:hypothetical protein